MKKITVIILVLLSTHAFAQSITTVQYSIGIGTGDLGDYISNPSFRGLSLEYRKLIQPNIGIGVEVGWNTFYEGQSGETYQRGKFTYSGNQYRYNNQFPMLFAADYYFSPEGNINPFVGLGMGVMYSLRNTDMSLYSFEEDAWNFTLRPEAGVLIKAREDVHFIISVKYFNGFEAGDLPAQSYLTFNLGFAFKK